MVMGQDMQTVCKAQKIRIARNVNFARHDFRGDIIQFPGKNIEILAEHGMGHFALIVEAVCAGGCRDGRHGKALWEETCDGGVDEGSRSN